MQIKGCLYVIAAPSGAGKTSLVSALTDKLDNVAVSISYTTRKIRPGEEDGVNYFFVDKPEFESMIAKGEFIEHANVFGNYYGSSKTWIKSALEKNKDIILEIDWQGAKQIRELFPDAVTIFIFPPSMDALEQRLTSRAQDDQAVIDSRMAQASQEMSHFNEFDYLIINDDFDVALLELEAIFIANRLRREKQLERHGAYLEGLL